VNRFFRSGLVRGLALIAAVSAAIVALSLQSSVATAGALVRVAFFLAIAFFLFLVWRERRSEIETWSDLSRRTFYGAIVLAVLDVAVLIGVGANGSESVVFLLVLAACAWAVVRVWRREHHYA
jgi:small-conductance mechanosensitive channel